MSIFLTNYTNITKKFDICVIQLTIYSRRYQWDEREEKFEHINDIDNFTLNRFNREYARDQKSINDGKFI